MCVCVRVCLFFYKMNQHYLHENGAVEYVCVCAFVYLYVCVFPSPSPKPDRRVGACVEEKRDGAAGDHVRGFNHLGPRTNKI